MIWLAVRVAGSLYLGGGGTASEAPPQFLPEGAGGGGGAYLLGLVAQRGDDLAAAKVPGDVAGVAGVAGLRLGHLRLLRRLLRLRGGGGALGRSGKAVRKASFRRREAEGRHVGGVELAHRRLPRPALVLVVRGRSPCARRRKLRALLGGWSFRFLCAPLRRTIRTALVARGGVPFLPVAQGARCVLHR